MLLHAVPPSCIEFSRAGLRPSELSTSSDIWFSTAHVSLILLVLTYYFASCFLSYQYCHGLGLAEEALLSWLLPCIDCYWKDSAIQDRPLCQRRKVLKVNPFCQQRALLAGGDSMSNYPTSIMHWQKQSYLPLLGYVSTW